MESADLLFKSYEIRSGKYQLQGLPAVWADENEAQTLEIVLADENAQVEVHLLYGVLEETDVITRSVRIKNTGTGQITIEKAAAACLDFVQLMMIPKVLSQTRDILTYLLLSENA